jgi:dynein heavy chain
VWIYLEPIFGSPDIVKHLPQEAAKFREVDTNWRAIMAKIHANTKVLAFTKNKKLLDTLKDCHNHLEFV